MDHQQNVHLDQATVNALKLPDDKADKIYFDDDLIGFGLRLRRRGDRVRGTYIAQYRVHGATRRVLIGDSEKISAKQARPKAKEILAQVTLGTDPQSKKRAERKAAALTIRAIADDYLAMKKLQMERGEYRAASFRVTKLYLTGMQYFGPLHTTPISGVWLADVARCLNSITRNSGSVTAGRARSALNSMCAWAMRQGFATHNPVIGTENVDAAPSRDRVLKDTELAAIWRACKDDDFGRIVRLLILTACRRDEIGGLRWNEIDLEAGTVTLPKERTKNRHEHTLPLTPMALEVIRSIPQRAGRDRVFGDRSAVGFTRWGEAKSDLDGRLDKIEPFRLHDLRRSVATWMCEHGDVEPHIVEAILNHYSGHRSGVAGVYNRAKYARQIATALALWAEHVTAIVEGRKRVVVPLKTA